MHHEHEDCEHHYVREYALPRVTYIPHSRCPRRSSGAPAEDRGYNLIELVSTKMKTALMTASPDETSAANAKRATLKHLDEETVSSKGLTLLSA